MNSTVPARRHGAPAIAVSFAGHDRCVQPARTPFRLRGFTLIELAVTLVVAAVLMGIAVPNMRAFVEKNRVKLAVGELATALNYARSEATKRRYPITVCARATDTSCAGGNTWNNGWLVFADADGNGSIELADGNEVLRVADSLPPNVTLQSKDFVTPGYMQYTAAGELNVNGKFKICNSQPGFENIARLIDISATGRASVDQTYYDCSAI